jgi:hypothetical protein
MQTPPLTSVQKDMCMFFLTTQGRMQGQGGEQIMKGKACGSIIKYAVAWGVKKTVAEATTRTLW